MAREIADRIAGARLLVLPGAMHCSAVEAAPAFHRGLRDFLDAVP
jgi:pimeloyl-ACP methyl ester carboxylesterase